MADEEAADDSKLVKFIAIYFGQQFMPFWPNDPLLTFCILGLQGQAEKMLNETKEKVSEYTEAAMEKVNNCKVS